MLNFFRPQSGSIKNDVLSGLTVALALVPEAIAFAFVAGVSPLIGLYSAFFIGLITAIFGGRPGMISGATGAMAVVIVALVAQYGVEYLFPTVILCGLLQIAIGMGRMGKFIRMVPHPVMLGFVNGLAIVIGLAQLGSFKTLTANGELAFLGSTQLALMLGLVLLTMGIIWLLPKFTQAVPASLVAILSVTIISVVVNQAVSFPDGKHALATVGDMLETNTQAAAIAQAKAKSTPVENHGADGRPPVEHRLSKVGLTINDATKSGEGLDTVPTTLILSSDPGLEYNSSFQPGSGEDAAPTPAVESGISGGLPQLFFQQYKVPPMNFQTLMIIFPFAVILCGVGLIESLMTMTLIDEITETRGKGNRECIGQGAANMVCGLFGGMGGCAMIGQSLINVNSGGRGRLSGITAAMCLVRV